MSFYALNHNSGRQIKIAYTSTNFADTNKTRYVQYGIRLFSFLYLFFYLFPTLFVNYHFPGVLYYFALGIYKIIDTQLPLNWHFNNTSWVAHHPSETLCYFCPLFLWNPGVFPILRRKLFYRLHVVQLNQSQRNAAFHSRINRGRCGTYQHVATV